MTASVKSGVDLPARNGRCPRGFSTLQIAILNVLKAHRQIIAYWQIAELITARFGMAGRCARRHGTPVPTRLPLA